MWSARLTDGTLRRIYRLGGLDGRNKSAQVQPGALTSQTIQPTSRIMTATSIGRIVGPSLALVAACGAALVFGTTHVRREPPVEIRAATAQAEANAVAALAVSPRSPDPEESVPVFDIARIERTGDAVIAGRAAPGAIVELLRNGEPHDRTVADQSGQFVMIPPRLPPGDYELTLRSRQADGKQATSKQSVVVALNEVESSAGAVRSRAEMPFNVPESVGTNRSVLDQAVGSSQAQQPSQRQDIAVSQQPHSTAAPPSVRRRLTVRRGRAQDRDHGRIPRRQPLAHQPCHLRRGQAICSGLQSEPGPNPKSKSYLSRPDLRPSYESALKRGTVARLFLVALDHVRRDR
jgi:hypothetical protein